MAVSRRSKVLGGLLLAALISVEAWYFFRPTKAPPGAPPDFLEPAEYERLLAVPITFDNVPEPAAVVHNGSGDHRGGGVPVTPHADGPAFGPGIKVAMTEAEFFQFYQAYESPKHPVFVTSDSLIQAYFSTLREELIRLEALNAWDLCDAVVDGLSKLDAIEIAGPPDVVAAARRLDCSVRAGPNEGRSNACENKEPRVPLPRARGVSRLPWVRRERERAH